jgi:hypothetical protein
MDPLEKVRRNLPQPPDGEVDLAGFDAHQIAGLSIHCVRELIEKAAGFWVFTLSGTKELAPERFSHILVIQGVVASLD